MAKFKVIERQGQIGIRCKLGSSEAINSSEILYFSQHYIRGLMQPTVEDAGRLFFIGAQGVPLSRFLRNPIGKDHFFMIAAQIMETYKSAVNNGLNPSNIVFDPDNIIIDSNSGELFFVYAAIYGNPPLNGGCPFAMNLIASNISFASQEEYNAVANFMSFVNSSPQFSVKATEEYIMNASPVTYSIIPRQEFNESPAPSAAVPAADPGAVPPPEAYAPQYAAPAPEVYPAPAAPSEMFSPGETFPASTAPVPPAEAPDEERLKINMGAAPAAVPESISDAPTIPPSMSAPAAAPEAPAEPAAAEEPPLSSKEPLSAEAPTLDRAAETSETMPVTEPAEPEPILTRRSTGDTFRIDKPVFRIGKERAKVDLCVTDNKTVSRVHATVLKRGGECFVKDNNSTNRTFINGTPIPVQTEIKLKNGDVLKLSNEEFDFTC